MLNARYTLWGIFAILFVLLILSSETLSNPTLSEAEIVREIHAAKTELRDYVDVKFTELNTKISGLDTKFATLDKNIAVMNAKLEATDKQINDLRGTLNLILGGVVAIIVSLLGYWTKPWWLKLFKHGSETNEYSSTNLQEARGSGNMGEFGSDLQSDSKFAKR